MKREIVTQAAFLTFPQDEIVNLLQMGEIGEIYAIIEDEKQSIRNVMQNWFTRFAMTGNIDIQTGDV